MKLLTVLGILLFTLTQGQSSQAGELKLASWNLGWHVSTTELPAWLELCSKKYLRNSQGRWEESDQEQAAMGWNISESRARVVGVDMKKTPPCSVYRANGFKGNLPVTASAWAKRLSQLSDVLNTTVNADVIAFQEVSGVQAVREALGDKAKDYEICSFEPDFKIQRLAFAWRKSKMSAIGPCVVHREIALSSLPTEQQLRPGLSVTLRAGSTTFRLLNLHLKSGCVSALEGKALDAEPKIRMVKGAKQDDPCPVLQQQIEPLETVFEALAQNVNHFLVMGDFNRNLWHELNAAEGSIRADASKSTGPLAGTKTNNLYREINDGIPSTSQASLVKIACTVDEESAAMCDFASKAIVKGIDKQKLVSSRALGCRNGIGLDHFLISTSWLSSVQSAEKIAIGRYGSSQGPNSVRPDPLLSVSDHCPIVLRVTIPG